MRKWIWLLVGSLIAAGVVACGQAGPPPLEETAVPSSSEISVPEAVTASPVLESVGAPAPLPAGTSISGTQRGEGIVVVEPTVPALSDPVLQALVTWATEDLAGRLSVEVEQIRLIETETVEWPDASLDCPQEGMWYAQVVTPGYRVILEAGGRTYEYHTDQDQVVVLCASIPSPAGPSKGGDTSVQDGWPSQPLGDDEIVRPLLEQK
jgi:hypothetical protein